MNILILDSYYSNFLSYFYSSHPNVLGMDFDSHRKFLMDERFGTSDAYSYNLNKLGYDAQEIVTNDDVLQLKWARENQLKLINTTEPVHRIFNTFGYNWRYKIIKAQVDKIKPDVLYIQEGNILSDKFILKLKPMVKLIIGQVASSIPSSRTYKSYDLVLTPLPHFIKCFDERGIKSEYFQLAFDERILKEIGPIEHTFDFTFVGGISKVHTNRFALINTLSEGTGLELFGYGKNSLNQNSKAYIQHHGETWGLEMYRTLAQSKISLNCHEEIAGNYASNMRLYEATGVGTCLITDWKQNLSNIFDLDKEILTFKSVEELNDKVNYFLDNDNERKNIAINGQKRVLKGDTYYYRMKQLLKIIGEYL
jgi:spore maturation protein CgeB